MQIITAISRTYPNLMNTTVERESDAVEIQKGAHVRKAHVTETHLLRQLWASFEIDCDKIYIFLGEE